MPPKNAAVCAASPARLASLARPCPVGSKKRSAASSFVYHSACPGSRGSPFHDAGIGRTLVVCAQKSTRLLDLDVLCRKTRQAVAYAVGDRSKRSCLRLWEAIPSDYRQGHCFTDFWA